jgi:hypothetical protein
LLSEKPIATHLGHHKELVVEVGRDVVAANVTTMLNGIMM